MMRNIVMRPQHMQDHGKRTYVFFSGPAMNQNWKRPDFYGQGKAMRVARIYVMERGDFWYNSHDYPLAVAEMRAFLERRRNVPGSRIIFVGLSRGGYGALKFALDLMPDKVIAFAPQVIHKKGPDLSELYRRAEKIPSVEIHLCRKSNDKRDHPHAEKMRGIHGISIVTHDCEKHNVPKELREKGNLQQILEAA